MARFDSERVLSLSEKYELGLKPKTVYQLVPEFFRCFESKVILLLRGVTTAFAFTRRHTYIRRAVSYRHGPPRWHASSIRKHSDRTTARPAHILHPNTYP